MKVYNPPTDLHLSTTLAQYLAQIRKERGFCACDYLQEKATLLARYLDKYRLQACVLGVSGGVDSAVALGILKHTAQLPNSPLKHIFALMMPVSNSSGTTHQNEATQRGKELCQKWGLKPYIIDLHDTNQAMRTAVETALQVQATDWAVGQLVSCSRTPIVYYVANLLVQEGKKAVVCGTTNLDEGGYLGFMGKASDCMVDLQLISDLHKSEVYALARHLDVLPSILEAVPSGDMYDARSDETVFGAPYDFVELYLHYLNLPAQEQNRLLNGWDDTTRRQFNTFAANLERLHRYNAHKYMVKSPAVHLDILPSTVKGGWDNSCPNWKEVLYGKNTVGTAQAS